MCNRWVCQPYLIISSSGGVGAIFLDHFSLSELDRQKTVQSEARMTTFLYLTRLGPMKFLAPRSGWCKWPTPMATTLGAKGDVPLATNGSSISAFNRVKI